MDTHILLGRQAINLVTTGTLPLAAAAFIALARYITRPAISEKRLSISPQGRVRYQLKTPWRNGTTHVEWDPVDFIAKLAALVPPPRAHLTRFHGIFAPNSSLRAQLTPSGRGKKSATDAALRIVASIEEPTAIRAILAHFEKHDAMDEAHYRPRPRGPPAVAMAA